MGSDRPPDSPAAGWFYCQGRIYKTTKSIDQRSARTWAKVRSCDESALYNIRKERSSRNYVPNFLTTIKPPRPPDSPAGV